jgi:hypothetical protein
VRVGVMSFYLMRLYEFGVRRIYKL